MNRYARKADANQPEIVQALRQAGWTVHHTHTLGQGFPDLACGKHGTTVLVECKMPGEMLTPAEKIFHAEFRGAVIIAFSGADAVQKCESHITHI